MAEETAVSGRQVVFTVVMIVGVAGAGLTYFFLIHQPQQRIAAAEEVNATVVSSNVERLERSNDRDRFRPNVTYRYTYEGKTYTSNNYYPGDETASFNKPIAQQRANTFQAGRNVTAHVNPDNPNKAYLLEPSGSRTREKVTVGVFALIALVSLAKVLGAVRGGE